MTYVNYRGEEIGLIDHGRAPKAKKEGRSFHSGWRVQGIPPGALEEARKEHHSDASLARMAGKPVKEWDEEHWLMNAKRKPVRSKPYEVPAAAEECKRMAQAAGWLRVEIVEPKKEVRSA